MNTNTNVKENKNYVQIIYKFNIIKDLGGKSVVFGTSRVDVPVPPPQVGRKNKREALELETSEKLKKGMMGTSAEREQGVMGRKKREKGMMGTSAEREQGVMGRKKREKGKSLYQKLQNARKCESRPDGEN